MPWPTLQEAQRRGLPQNKGRVEKLPQIEKCEAQLEAIRAKIRNIQGKRPPRGPSVSGGRVERLDSSAAFPPRDKRPPSASRREEKPRAREYREPPRPSKLAPSVSCPSLQRGKVLAALQQDLYSGSAMGSSPGGVRPAKGGREAKGVHVSPACDSSALAIFLGMQQPKTFGALQLGGSTESIASAAVARRERATRSRDAMPLLSRVPRMFESITWTAGPLSEEMRSAIGKWVRGTVSGPQCKVCLDYLGWPHPFGEPDLSELQQVSAEPLDRALPALSGLPSSGGPDLDSVFTNDVQEVLQDLFARCQALCGEVVFAEQVWLAARVLAQRSFSRCHAANLGMYRAEEVIVEAMRQRFVGSPLCAESAGLRDLQLGDTLEALQCPAANRASRHELDTYLRRQFQLRQELVRQNDALKRDEAYVTLGLDAAEQVDTAQLKKQYWQLAKERHPDRGGSHEGFQELQSAYRHLLEAPDGPALQRKTRRKLGHETRGIREDVARVQALSYDCAGLVQQAFRELRTGRMQEWTGIIDEAAGKARLVGEQAQKLALRAVEAIEDDGMQRCLSVLPDSADTCKSAGADTAALARRTAEIVCDALAERLTSKDPKARMMQQHRMLALGLHAALAASDAAMACSELGQVMCYEVMPDPPKQPASECGSPIRARDASPRSPREAAKEGDDEDEDAPPLGRTPTKKDGREFDRNSPVASPPTAERDQTDRDTVVKRIQGMNSDLLDLQKQLRGKLSQHPSLDKPNLETKHRVFGLVSAFLDDACLEFARRLATKATLAQSLDAFWWLTPPGSLAVPTGVQGVVLRSALGLDAQRLRTQVSGELFPRLRTTLLKLRSRRAIPVPKGAEAQLIAASEEAELREREAQMLERLEPSGF